MILTINGQQFALKKDKKNKKQTKIENNHYLCKKLISFDYEDIIIASYDTADI